MYELKYSVTENDIHAVNKKAMLPHLVLYFAVALIGLAVGIVAVTLSGRTFIFVMSIIIIVFAALLLIVALIMLFAPKVMLQSALEPSDDEYTVVVDKTGITVGGEHLAAFVDISKVKNYGEYIAAFTAKSTVFIIKNAFTSEGNMAELHEYMSERCGRILLDSASDSDNANDK